MKRSERKAMRTAILYSIFGFAACLLGGCGAKEDPIETLASTAEKKLESEAYALELDAEVKELEQRVKAHLPAAGYVDLSLIPEEGDLESPPKFDEVVSLRVGAPWVFNDEAAPWFIGQDLGFFREAGLEIDLLEGGPGRNPLTLLLGKQLDIAVSADSRYVPAVLASPTGGDVVIVNGVLKKSPVGVLTLDRNISKEERSDWQVTSEDMRDSVFGVQAGSERLADLFLQVSGLPEGSVDVVRSGNGPELLMTGRADFMLAWIVNQPRILEANGFYNWRFFPFSDYFTTAPSGVSIVLRETLEQRADVIYRYNWAVLKSVRFMLDHTDEAAEITERYTRAAGLTVEQIKQRFELQRELIEGDDPNRLLHIDIGMMDKAIAYDVLAGSIELPASE